MQCVRRDGERRLVVIPINHERFTVAASDTPNQLIVTPDGVNDPHCEHMTLYLSGIDLVVHGNILHLLTLTAPHGLAFPSLNAQIAGGTTNKRRGRTAYLQLGSQPHGDQLLAGRSDGHRSIRVSPKVSCNHARTELVSARTGSSNRAGASRT